MTKQEMIKRMQELQSKFMEIERKDGIDPFDYYTPAAGHFLESFKKEYNDLALKVLETAHSEIGSSK